jgi:hypothetical protein
VPWLGGTVLYCYQPSSPVAGHAQPGTAALNQAVQLTHAEIAKSEAIPDGGNEFQVDQLCPHWDDVS